MARRDETTREVHVVAIPGSLRRPSHTRSAAALALEGAAAAGATVRMIDLDDYELPHCTGEDADDEVEGVLRLRADVAAADGIVLATPEYHGSYSGVLKNALDLMGFSEFEGKMVGLVGVSGGALGATAALSALRDVGRALHAWVVPRQAGVPRAWKHFDEEGALDDEKLADRLRAVGEQVARFCALHTSETAQEFLRVWEGAPDNPGGT